MITCTRIITNSYWIQSEIKRKSKSKIKKKNAHSVGFRVEVLSSARWLEMVQGAEKGEGCRGVETYHFANFWLWIGKLYIFTIDLEKGGQNGGAYVVIFI